MKKIELIAKGVNGNPDLYSDGKRTYVEIYQMKAFMDKNHYVQLNDVEWLKHELGEIDGRQG